MWIAGMGVVDAAGVSGSGGLAVSFARAGIDPLADRFPWEAVLGRPEPTLRRVDGLGRFACLAADAAGCASALPSALRARTAVVLASTHGCLDSDVRFARSLDGEIASGLFAFTLPSTCLGLVAIRHGLCGPTLCLSATERAAAAAVALVEAHALLEAGEADAALVLAGDAVTPAIASASGVRGGAASTTMGALLIMRAALREPALGRVEVLFGNAPTVDALQAVIRARYPLPEPGSPSSASG